MRPLSVRRRLPIRTLLRGSLGDCFVQIRLIGSECRISNIRLEINGQSDRGSHGSEAGQDYGGQGTALRDRAWLRSMTSMSDDNLVRSGQKMPAEAPCKTTELNKPCKTTESS